MSEKLAEGKLPEPAPVLSIEDARKRTTPHELEDEIANLPVAEGVKKLCAQGYNIRHVHSHTFEVGGEEKKVVNILCTLD